jgi:hypothetical protein
MLTGVCAGIGKSTLAEGLAGALRGQGAAVDLFPEEQIFTRPHFAEVAEGFRSKEFAGPEAFERAWAAQFAELRAAGAWGVFDWSCVGMAGDLPWAIGGQPALTEHVLTVRKLAEADGLAPVVLDLDCDLQSATAQAMAQRGAPWIDRYTGLAAANGHRAGTAQDRITAWARARQPARADESEALYAAGWPIHPLDAPSPPHEVLAQALLSLPRHPHSDRR